LILTARKESGEGMNCLHKKYFLFFMSCSFIVFLSVFLTGCSSDPKGKTAPEVVKI